MGPEEFETDIGHLAPLGNDNIPDVNQSHYCHSCETPFTGVYCTSCGQKNDDYRRSLFSLIKEFLSSVTAIESRIWRTWAALLFKPGKVAREYADGRRTHWSSPVRVYIAMSILLFGFLSVTQMQLISIDVDVQPIEGVTKPVEDMTADDLKLVPAMHFFETRRDIDARNKTRNFDLIRLKLNAGNGIKLDIDTDSIKDNVNERTERAIENGSLSPEDAAEINEALDMLKAGQESSAEDKPVTETSAEGSNTIIFSDISGQKYEIGSMSDVLLPVIRNPTKINGAVFKYLPRIMFLMMPFTMLIGAMFVRGRGNALLYDHLVHAAYIHAVAFFLILLGILLSFVLPGGAISRFIFLALLIYLPLSLKRMFGRGWFKTIWTSYGVGFIYAFNLALIMIALLGIQLVSTVTELGTQLPS